MQEMWCGVKAAATTSIPTLAFKKSNPPSYKRSLPQWKYTLNIPQLAPAELSTDCMVKLFRSMMKMNRKFNKERNQFLGATLFLTLCCFQEHIWSKPFLSAEVLMLPTPDPCSAEPHLRCTHPSAHLWLHPVLWDRMKNPKNIRR